MQEDSGGTKKSSGGRGGKLQNTVKNFKIPPNDKNRAQCLGKDKQVHKTGWETGQGTTLLKMTWDQSRLSNKTKQDNSSNKTNKP